ncbi:MAG: ROK family transcriptional regulator [Halanaerobiales bacterium]
MIKNTRELKQHNKCVLLSEIIDRQPVSRKDLSSVLDVSHATVSSIIKELKADGLVVETEFQESTGGRPPRLIEFRGEKKYVVSVEMSYTYISYAIYDLNFKLRKQESWKIEGVEASRVIKELLERILDNFYKKEMDIASLIGIGISVPGIYNSQEGVLTDSISEVWQNVNLEKLFEKELRKTMHGDIKIPLYIENDANLSTYYESFYGVGMNVDNLLYIFIAEGIGSGLVVNGQLYRGAHGIAGEISHIKVSDQDYPCSCGGTGCLEVMSSMSAIKRKVKENLSEGIESQLQDLADAQISIEEIINAYREGDDLCEKVINQSVKYLIKALSGLVNFLDPDLLVIGDIYNLYDQKMIEEINHQLKDLCYSDRDSQSLVVQRTEKEYIQLMATAKYVFDKWKHNI